MIFSRFGTVAEPIPNVGLDEVLNSEAIEEADIVVIDSASSLMPDGMNDQARFDMIQRLRKIASTGRSLMLNVDRDEMDAKLLHSLRASAEVVLDLSTNLIGVTSSAHSSSRYLRLQVQYSRPLDGVLNQAWASLSILQQSLR